MSLINKNSAGQDYTNNADGASLGGGVLKRFLNWIGGNITLTGGGSATLTFPTNSDTMVGRASIDTLTNKAIAIPLSQVDTTVTIPADCGMMTPSRYVIGAGETLILNDGSILQID